ncbi:MAG: lipopolysaccharide transport periplasmic protein LptA [Gammaproteobacteria bacterium]|nr:MAG: lipopolysaccharide transport periplasmic protein LptA [Pseudomonadota bacterium]PIE38202.1 MAG: lipopolysaccharide transport periplasmic protein LptA [Gammaproteobacteria bacterium]
MNHTIYRSLPRRPHSIAQQQSARSCRFFHIARLFTLLLSLCLGQGALAMSSTSDAPIHIKADKAKLDDQKGIATYKGDVIISQGTSTLEADTVIIYANDSGLIKIIATGSPAHFQQKMNDSTLTTHAFGDRITYTHAARTITLQKNARLEQGKNRFQGDVIEYNTESRVVTATGNGRRNTPGGRVELIFHPKKAKGPARINKGKKR